MPKPQDQVDFIAMAATINENVIRWSEIRLPNPARPGELASWPIDGPFAVRKYYRVEGSSEMVELNHIERRNDNGTLSGCMYCGESGLTKTADVTWRPIVIWAAIALAVVSLALFLLPPLFGWLLAAAAILIAGYPIWFLYASAPRIETCSKCTSQFVNFCFGPRP